MKNSKITVVIMTYNQEDYIEQALQSVLSQKTQVDFDILVHDDCSDDNTYKTLLEYANKFPKKIRIIRQDRRKFLDEGFNMMIFNHVISEISSKYVAYCDGDDYWCDEGKLQKQYEFLESHPDYSMCFHSAYQLRQNGDMSSKWFIDTEGDIELADIINDKPGIHIATSSIFLKADVFKDFSDWRKRYPVEDIPLYMTAALSGKIHRLPDIMCVYRQFASGSWSSQNKNDVERIIKHLTNMKESVIDFDFYTDKKYHGMVVKQIESFDFRIAFYQKDLRTIFSKKNSRFVKRMNYKERFSLKLQYRLPRLYNLLHNRKKKD